MDERSADVRGVLDHGYVQLIEAWGSDERIIEAARMSTAKGFTGWGPKCRACGDSFDGPERDCPEHIIGRPYVDRGRGGHMFDAPGDEKLLAYLWSHQHATPFEMAGLIVEVKAPIFVFREWHRHRTQSFNEMSARYVPLPDEHYIPSVDRLMATGGANKQAGVAAGATFPMTTKNAEAFQRELARAYSEAERLYRDALDASVPKELARLIVPVARYSRMRASANLRNWLGFLKLRCDSTAQWEIRQYANAVAGLVRERFPRTYDVARESVGMP
jgi:thymidylate synthase (FAD)